MSEREQRLEALLREAVQRLDMAFAMSEDERLAKRYAETRDKIRVELRGW